MSVTDSIVYSNQREVVVALCIKPAKRFSVLHHSHRSSKTISMKASLTASLTAMLTMENLSWASPFNPTPTVDPHATPQSTASTGADNRIPPSIHAQGSFHYPKDKIVLNISTYHRQLNDVGQSWHRLVEQTQNGLASVALIPLPGPPGINPPSSSVPVRALRGPIEPLRRGKLIRGQSPFQLKVVLLPVMAFMRALETPYYSLIRLAELMSVRPSVFRSVSAGRFLLYPLHPGEAYYET
ncbi:hypothetical protein L249_5196 [Ophiocordyceps polyrhachis-furcata BCC 54312]|uniref:Uncharacterized protein n=1 Tax=Ophiocordyceps polyrhachis-furcata BCC 54312 TaxID=1330021 RepID=A0A367L8V0_9HYPO|nr:hypothetical protein L249_5196 [Ophiocordyceps polyrhachis-furcata BCC 54312]